MRDFYNTVNMRKREEVSGLSRPNKVGRQQERERELPYTADLRDRRERVGMRRGVEDCPNLKVNTAGFPCQSTSVRGQEHPDRWRN